MFLLLIRFSSLFLFLPPNIIKRFSARLATTSLPALSSLLRMDFFFPSYPRCTAGSFREPGHVVSEGRACAPRVEPRKRVGFSICLAMTYGSFVVFPIGVSRHVAAVHTHFNRHQSKKKCSGHYSHSRLSCTSSLSTSLRSCNTTCSTTRQFFESSRATRLLSCTSMYPTAAPTKRHRVGDTVTLRYLCDPDTGDMLSV